ncbi:programmed cell death protein 2 [Bisporella sp. PMI_857]|nr:programmed cell death protein 2 [Bisporella sp. PMI_857]
MSDSESSDDENYTVTNVLLGYTTEEPRDDEISHLGGRPSWIDPSSPPSATLAKCKVCNDLMVLLLQLNAELPDFLGHERRLYILTCRRKTCRRREGSIRTLRGVRISEAVIKDKKAKEPKLEENIEPPKPVVHLGESLFGTKPLSGSTLANPFSTASSATPSNPFSTSSSTSANPFSSPKPDPPSPAAEPQSPSTSLPQTFASALSLGSPPTPQVFGPPEPWPEESSLPPAYPLYYLDPDYEELDPITLPAAPVQTMDLDDPSSSSNKNQKEDKDVYESTIDHTFQKFADRLSQNPDQVLRYEFRGTPLLYSKHDAVGKLLGGGKGNERVKVGGNGIPRCENCGSGRVFEVQLTPHAILELERDEIGFDGMDWGTIMVGVCERDCQQRGVDVGMGYLEEWTGVQWEELGEKR